MMMGDEVQRSLGRIEGSLETMAKTVETVASDVSDIKVSQAETVQTVGVHVTKIKDAEADIDSLKASRNKITGMAIAFGALGSGAIKLIGWVFTKTGGV